MAKTRRGGALIVDALLQALRGAVGSGLVPADVDEQMCRLAVAVMSLPARRPAHA